MSQSENLENDLPEDRCSSVLLLGVTRIPSSPLTQRRPNSLPLTKSNPFKKQQQQQQQPLNISVQERRRSFSSSSFLRQRFHSSLRKSEKCPISNNSTFTDDDKVMDRSVDSIGTCSLDIEVSADMSDLSEISSTGTLRSVSLKTPSSTTEAHLPSYLSLACTVNGYSTTTNYDPIRLSRSRDASPHRFDNDNLMVKNVPTYSVNNNLLSPPNLVPLPINNIKERMSDNTTTITTTTTTTLSQTMYNNATRTISSYKSNLYSKDTVDCFQNGNGIKAMNGENNKEYANGDREETKSFIEQRVERLYGPGALAQGFFVTKRQAKYHHHHQRILPLTSDLDRNKIETSVMKQSTSSPTLPVLRHLRPEFRAQLPIISPAKKMIENSSSNNMPKSCTLPILKDEFKLNGHLVNNGKDVNIVVAKKGQIIQQENGEKNGHYFLKILQCETERLLKLADNVEEELTDPDLPEEIIGKIRSAAGKARLLVTQKMQQFKGLCTNNMTQVEGEAFPTTNEDLQGFWDMVMLQVDQVDALFKEINKLKANNWIEEKSKDLVNDTKSNNNIKTKKLVKRPVTSVNEEVRKQREAQRKQMIEERRKAMKKGQNNNNTSKENIEIFVPESS